MNDKKSVAQGGDWRSTLIANLEGIVEHPEDKFSHRLYIREAINALRDWPLSEKGVTKEDCARYEATVDRPAPQGNKAETTPSGVELAASDSASRRVPNNPAAAGRNPNDGEFGLPVEHRQFDKEDLSQMVDRFLRWPLPDSVCSDGCVTQRDYGKAQGWPKRSGTNLLTADEARQMLIHVLANAAPQGGALTPQSVEKAR